MMATLEEFNLMRVSEGQEEICIGIGINTGVVVTGAIGSSRALQYTAIGDAVNTASRLCSIAKPGEIILSQATYDKVKDHVTVVPREPVRLKGKSEELRTYRVVAIHDSDWRSDATNPATP
jgi:class 3 adenylate cyclase